MSLFQATSTVLIGFAVASTAVADIEPQQMAKEILAKAGVTGGVIVHLDCGDGKLTAALQTGDSLLVHGLDKDADDVAEARKHIQSLGRYGRVFVEHHEGGRLPYIDNSVNLILAERRGEVPRAEILRVLVPNGVVCVKSNGVWIRWRRNRGRKRSINGLTTCTTRATTRWHTTA